MVAGREGSESAGFSVEIRWWSGMGSNASQVEVGTVAIGVMLTLVLCTLHTGLSKGYHS